MFRLIEPLTAEQVDSVIQSVLNRGESKMITDSKWDSSWSSSIKFSIKVLIRDHNVKCELVDVSDSETRQLAIKIL